MGSERQREKLEGEVRLYEDKVNRMRQQMDDMVSTFVGDVKDFRGTDADFISKRPRTSCNWRSGARSARSQSLGRNL